MSIIGILDSASPNTRGEEMDAFYDGLASTGRNGQNTSVLHTWADNDYSQLDALADQLIANNVAVIVAAGGPVSAIVAQNKTSTIPIVFTTITNPGPAPDGSDLVQNLSAPEGNVTGTFGHTTDLDHVRLAGLAVLADPGPIGILCNPKRPFPRNENPIAQENAYKAMVAALNRTAIVVNASTNADIEGAFNQFKGSNVKGLLVSADAIFNSRRQAVLALADRLEVPAMYQWRAYVADGGLMSYGPTKTDGYHNAGEYAGRILNGEPIASLPVRESTMRDFFVSSQAAARMRMNPKSSVFRDAATALGVTTITEI